MLDKTYQPAAVEGRRYAGWERSGGFAAELDSQRQPYTIMMPPPNVTGSLHIGHALNFTLQDVLVRYQRMRGRDVLWQPGTDHAGIATETAKAAIDSVFDAIDDDRLLESSLRKRLRGREAIADDREFARLFRYLIGQGFESDRVMKALKAYRMKG